jgi:hypothetical protein
MSLIAPMRQPLRPAGTPRRGSWFHPISSMQGQSFRAMLTQSDSYAGRTYVFSERNWHDCDEHQRAVRTSQFKLIRTDAYTALPLCTAGRYDIGRYYERPGSRQGPLIQGETL